MKDNNSRRRPMNQQDELDRELDAGLTTFAAVEPRTGLEERILANLRCEHGRAATHSWLRWPALGVIAAALIVAALSIVWRPGKSAQIATEHRAATTRQIDKQTGTHMTTNNAGGSSTPAALVAIARPARHSVCQPQAIIAPEPRLAQFPSLRPLSEQEKLLVRYVQDFPREAATIARAEAESEKEIEQLSGDQPSETNPDQQDQPQER
jgi:hypothetical protein